MQKHSVGELQIAESLTIKAIENNMIFLSSDERNNPEIIGAKIAALFNTLVEKLNY